ncbi:MAG TPA: type II toxin-antitoxin system RelE/ParE family toxin [Pseudomonadales bacterium]|nr:type II toxin-antitoxin system RelE/ParE family toxin [Pseudomonadales bacterium]
MSTPTLLAKFYRTDAGNEPVRDFLLSLTAEDRKAIGTDIKTVQFGWPLGMPLVRKLDKDLWEVRSDIADGIARILFTVYNGQMVLLHAIVKKSQKTPPNDIRTANSRMHKL